MEHCISLFRNKQIEKSYKLYVTETLRSISENTSRNGGVHMTKGFGDILDGFYNTQTDKISDEEKADEIKGKIFSKLRGE